MIVTYQEFKTQLNEDCQYLLEERAAIHEFDGNLPRREAEQLAMMECAHLVLEI